jgi:hypothetical protein
MVPERWQDVIDLLLLPIAWIPRMQDALLAFFLGAASPWATAARLVFLLLPALVGVAAIWVTLLAAYTLPFRARRVRFVSLLLLAWWDAARVVWLYWVGLVRVAALLVGWTVSVAALLVRLLVEAVHRLATTPVALTARAAHRYVAPGTPWMAFLAVLAWGGLEAAVFTYTTLPAISNTLSELGGGMEPTRYTAGVVFAFLLLLVLGSFACVQSLADGIRRREAGIVAQMVLVQALVMAFEVTFFYRQLVVGLAPWTRAAFGPGTILGLAALAWLATRATTWWLFGRYGTAPLLALIARRPLADALTDEPTASFGARSEAWWRRAGNEFRLEVEWMHAKSDQLLELLALPVLQLVAAALNFALVAVASRPAFDLPFRTMRDVADTRELLVELQLTPRRQPSS